MQQLQEIALRGSQEVIPGEHQALAKHLQINSLEFTAENPRHTKMIT